jgi:hypothetical protein
MFMIAMPKDFTVGQTADCRINGKPQRLTWRDEDTLVIEPGDARKILTAHRSRELIHFACGDAGLDKADYGCDGPVVYEKPPARREYWWLAVNGASVSACSFPAQEDRVACHPTPEQLIGFPTQEEQMEAQRFLLTADIPAIRRRMQDWVPRMRKGEMAYIRPEQPEPPTSGPTAWVV